MKQAKVQVKQVKYIAEIYVDFTPEERLDMVVEILKEGIIKLWNKDK